MSVDAFCNVQNKISCCFDTVVIEGEPSTKRTYQSYRVVAGDTLRTDAEKSSIGTAHASEKVDGTCVFIAEYQGIPTLWARHDRKPNKAAEKRFKKFQNSKRAKQAKDTEPPHVGDQDLDQFIWNIDKDFKDVPPDWIPASGIPVKDDIPQPDKGGHIPGWVPVDPTSRQHCWHLSAVDTQQQIGLFLVPGNCEDESGDRASTRLDIMVQPLKDYIGCTLELIGTNINGNPYGIGSKQSPLHLLVRHGSLSFQNPPPLDYVKIKSWFQENPEGQIEGVVWHCKDGRMFKLHRHHLDLKWPVESSRIQNLKIRVNLKDDELIRQSSFEHLLKINGKCFSDITKLTLS